MLILGKAIIITILAVLWTTKQADIDKIKDEPGQCILNWNRAIVTSGNGLECSERYRLSAAIDIFVYLSRDAKCPLSL
jgi:hypothetical protein